MIRYILNGENMTTRAAAHTEIRHELHFPLYYGNNLDALWDLISCTDADVTLRNPAPLLNALGAYGCQLLQTFYDAARDNPNFRFQVEE